MSDITDILLDSGTESDPVPETSASELDEPAPEDLNVTDEGNNDESLYLGSDSGSIQTYSSTGASGSYEVLRDTSADQSFYFAIIFVISMIAGLMIFSLLTRRW